MSFMHLSTLLLASGLALSGCSSTPVATPMTGTSSVASRTPSSTSAARPSVEPSQGQANAGTSRPVGSTSPSSNALAAHLDPNSEVSKGRSIYFDYDDFSISSQDAKSLIEVHGKYLLSRPQLAIKVEGNADERGGAEYNLALGQKRAEAVTRALTLYGVKESRMEAISWGKERPKAMGHDETAWAENRRADLVYPSK